jgi:hypothetical protein
MGTNVLSDCVSATLSALAQQFQRAEPFRHVVIDGFLEPRFATRLLEEFPSFDPTRAINEMGGQGRKSVHERIRGLGPAYARLDDLVKGRDFLELVSGITGIPDLLYDPHYFGGGTHDNRDGQGLDAHVDFNRHPVTHSHRRLNLIVYLNPDWQPEWGGALELHSDPRSPDDRVVQVLPLFNRAVLFETTEHSWHGFSRIALPASHAGEARRSIALYFYSAERPAEELAATHSTVYVDSPMPARIEAGLTLTGADVAELQGLMASRDQHIQRLYRDIRELQGQLEQAHRAIGLVRGSRVFRTLASLRRMLRRRPPPGAS